MLLDLIKTDDTGQMFFDFEIIEVAATQEFKNEINLILNTGKYDVSGFKKCEFYLEIILKHKFYNNVLYYRYDLDLLTYNYMFFNKSDLEFIKKGFGTDE